MKNITLLILSAFFIVPIISDAQTGAFTVTGAGYSTAVVTDYQCVGLNPANLGWKRNDHLMNIGIGEGGISIYSEPLKRAFVKDLFNTDKKFTSAEKQEAVQNFTDAKLQFEGNVSGFGLSFQDEKIGGFGFNVRERLLWDSNLNEYSSDILFNGYNADYFDSFEINDLGDTVGIATLPQKVSDLFEGSKLDMLWYREFNFSYGRIILNSDNFKLYGGIGIKYIEGYSMFNYSYSSDGVIKAFSALNPVLGVDYDSSSPSTINNSDYQSIGQGWGFDIGFSALLYNKLRLAVSVTDIGSIKWDGNVYEGENAALSTIESAGIDNYNILELQNNEIFNSLKFGSWDGLENKTTKLPMNVRAGAAYLLNDKFEFGTEFYIPTNDVPGAVDKMIFGLGTRIMPVKWFRVSAGLVTGGDTGTDIPMGISFFPFNNDSFSWELGFAVSDITSYFKQDKPTVSLAFGLLRFSFGNLGTSTAETSDE